jgi:DHA2 family multidrug resistance protein
MLNGEITRQAAMVAFIDDFKLMMWITLGAVPLLLLLRKPQAVRVMSAPKAHAALD